jgi:hypothetical protein
MFCFQDIIFPQEGQGSLQLDKVAAQSSSMVWVSKIHHYQVIFVELLIPDPLADGILHAYTCSND